MDHRARSEGTRHRNDPDVAHAPTSGTPGLQFDFDESNCTIFGGSIPCGYESSKEDGSLVLKGLTWAHSRGYVPLVATAQAYFDRHPDIEIVWERRSLRALGEQPINDLVDAYDLLIIDHPFIGLAAARGTILPLDEQIDTNILGQLASQSVGSSYLSYAFDGHQWALPVDAASQVAAYRPDLHAQLGADIPQTWQDVLDLADASGRVAIPLTEIDALSAFFSLCANLGDRSRFEHPWREPEVAELALGKLKALALRVDRECFDMSPIALLNRMSSTDDIVYTPITYGYSNYSRDGFAPRRIAFGGIPAAGSRGFGGATLGGAGLAISARTSRPAEAADYASWVAGAECQRTIYTLSGGQPGNRLAWQDELVNRVTHGFFTDTMSTVDTGYLRPNHPEWPALQAEAATRVHRFLKGQESASAVVRALGSAHRATASHPC